MSIDQIVSDQPGLIPQNSGFLSRQRLWGCTTFLNHVSDYVYVHIMRDLTQTEMLLSKKAFEKMIAQSGKTIKHYHTYTGIFSDNVFIDSVYQKYQNTPFCGAGDHHQKGIVKNKNKILTTSARILLIYGMGIWQKMIDYMLCKFAMKAIAERLNSLQIYHNGRTPEYM